MWKLKTGIAKEILERGGISIGRDEKSPSGRYMVSFPTAKETIIPIKKFKDWDVYDFFSENENIFNKCPNAYLGAWVDGELVHLDISICIECLDVALTLPREFGQDAIYDISGGYISTEKSNEVFTMKKKLEVSCDKCGKEVYFIAKDKEKCHSLAMNNGWAFGDKDFCPKCKGK